MAYYNERHSLVNNERHVAKNPLMQASDELNLLNQTAGRIEELAGKVNSPLDSPDLRLDLKSARSKATNLIKSIAAILKQPAAAQDKPSYDKILSQLQQAVAYTKRVSEQSIQKERAHPNPPSSSSAYNPYAQHNQSSSGGYGASGGYDGRQGQMTLNAQDDDFELNLVEKTEVDIDNAMIRQRNQDMKEINEDIHAMADVFEDTHRLVYEDRELFNKAESHAARAQQTIKEGAQTIQVASQRQNKSRMKSVCTIALIIICIVVVSAIIALVMGLFSF